MSPELEKSAAEDGESVRCEVDRAMDELRKVQSEIERLEDIRGGQGPTPDGLKAMRQAARRHTRALKQLREALERLRTWMATCWPGRHR